MSADRWRLFVAAPMPQPADRQLWDLLADLRGRHPEARWMPPEQYHATLVFLGSTDPTLVHDITAGIQRAASAIAPFEVEVGEGSGRAGGHRGGVAWLRLASGRPEMESLALAVDREIGSGAYSAAAPPRPHVTVARRVDERFLADLRRETAGLALRGRVERIVLYRSHTGPAGSVYEELATASLAGRAA